MEENNIGEIQDWSKPDEKGIINVPDELDGLVNVIGLQVQLHTFSKRFGEEEMICRIAYRAQKFFSKSINEKDKEIEQLKIDLKDMRDKFDYLISTKK